MFFLVAFFLFKTTSVFKNTETYRGVNQENGLTYSDMLIEDLVNRDTDSDGIKDWQESLYGLDPTKKETVPGTPDSMAINKLRVVQRDAAETTNGNTDNQIKENLTETEKFSRELFATMATAASQNGQIDQDTIKQLGDSLAEKIQNSVPRKVYAISDIKITYDNTKQTIQKYSDTLDSIYLKSYTKKGVMTIMEEFIADEKNISILSELDPIINQTNKIISESLKIQTPQSLSLLHLDLINNSQRLLENITDMKLLDTDPMVAISAIIKYEENATALELAANRLIKTIDQKLNN